MELEQISWLYRIRSDVPEGFEDLVERTVLGCWNLDLSDFEMGCMESLIKHRLTPSYMDEWEERKEE